MDEQERLYVCSWVIEVYAKNDIDAAHQAEDLMEGRLASTWDVAPYKPTTTMQVNIPRNRDGQEEK